MDDIQKCIELLKHFNSNGAHLEGLDESLRIALMSEAGKLSRPTKMDLKQRNREIMKARQKRIVAEDKKARAATGIREARRQAVFVAPAQTEVPEGTERLKRSRSCYVCKKTFNTVHAFYDSMCTECGDFNYQKRFQTASLEGQVALITGARLKIGYQSALMMLRAGARVIVSTRFPVDAAQRFSREPDFSSWADRLSVHGLDLRHIPSVEIFCAYVTQNFDRLDILINNAAQTVRRPTGFYAHLMGLERTPARELPKSVAGLLQSHENCKAQLKLPASGIATSAELSQVPYSFDGSLSVAEVFPEGKLDADLQQVDLRKNNSWRMTLADVPTMEMLEVQLVNSVAPFVLCSRLTPLMRRNPTGRKHIVNVSAMEGKFSRYTKTDKHPHTNMAKAALNMLTLTSAPDLAKDGIFMNAVDTGWVTDEDPKEISLQKQEMHDFEPPLDIVDGAARVCDPFFNGILTGRHWCGQFLKDYFPTEW